MPRNEERASLRKIWGGMKKRCYNTESKDYRNYGAKGIRICDEWLNDFESFYTWAMSHGYQRGLTIDRICNSRGYSPGNCRWVTRQSQAFNRRNNTRLEIRGRTMTLTEWSHASGVKVPTIIRRMEAGWSVEDAVLTPTGRKRGERRR